MFKPLSILLKRSAQTYKSNYKEVQLKKINYEGYPSNLTKKTTKNTL